MEPLILFYKKMYQDLPKEDKIRIKNGELVLRMLLKTI